jgi:hypothetical protein
MRKYDIVEDNEPQECLDCGHSGNNHAEYEVKGQDEAEVVCPEFTFVFVFVFVLELVLLFVLVTVLVVVLLFSVST